MLEPAALLVPEFHGIGLRLLFRWKLIGRYLRDMKIAEDGPVSLLAFGFVPEEDLVGLTQPDAVGLVTIVSLEDKQEGRGAGTEIGGMDQGGKGILCGLAALHERLAMATLAYVWGEIGVRGCCRLDFLCFPGFDERDTSSFLKSVVTILTSFFGESPNVWP